MVQISSARAAFVTTKAWPRLCRLIATLAFIAPAPSHTARADQPQAPASQNQPQRFEFTETHMGSPVHIVLYTKDAATAKAAATAAFARMARLDLTFSDYNPYSELMKLVDTFATGARPPVAVSADLYNILSQSAAISRTTGAAFDITAAPVIRLWRRARRDRKMPSADHLREALARVDYRRVRLFPDTRQARLEPGTRLDLGGIAKGYAAAEMLKVLEKQGIGQALVSVAGDIAAGDAPPGRPGWRVDVAGLKPLPDKPATTLEIARAAVSTSGDAERFVEIDGRRYSHIVDPKTGLGLVRRASVTVVSALGESADAYATALYLLGPRGPDLLGGLATPPRLSVFWQEEPTPGTLIEKRSGVFLK
ncbi:MAG: FAD:protein FMN transferase [bacterium]